jgi:hypothetical protein
VLQWLFASDGRIGPDMEQRYHTPEELVAGLHGLRPGARAQLWQLLREPLAQMMHKLISRHGLNEEGDLLTTHALHSAETALRSRQPGAFAGLSWSAFRGTLLVQMARLATQPHGTLALAGSPAPLPLPEAPGYQSQTFFRPFTRLGQHFFGGDWYAGRQLDDGSLWVFLADVTGHGYFAYLLASGLPALWQRCWSIHARRPPEPAALLASMHEMLCESMPEGIFLEGTLVRLDSAGMATVVPAGGTRLLVRRGSRRPELLKLRGAWLGLRAPSPDVQHRLALGDGDEILLTTDGVFEQLEDHDGQGLLAAHHDGELFDSLCQRIEQSLASAPQKDDITMVLLRRRVQREQAARTIPIRPMAASSGAGDVPV